VQVGTDGAERRLHGPHVLVGVDGGLGPVTIDGVEFVVLELDQQLPPERRLPRAPDAPLVHTRDGLGRPGAVAIMVRYQGHVATFGATVPLGIPVKNLPAPNGYIDELVFKKLKQLGLPPSSVADDATLLRRVSVDITGRLPDATTARVFLDDPSPDKRRNHREVCEISGTQHERGLETGECGETLLEILMNVEGATQEARRTSACSVRFKRRTPRRYQSLVL